MSNAQSAIVAATIADDVYALTKQLTKEDALRLLNRLYKGSFSFADDNLLTAKTGGPPGFKISTGFGFVLLGKKAPYKGHAFIVFRGTQLLADWLTNGHIATSRSESGHLVHGGFHNTFNTMKPRLKDFVNVINQPRHGIHTVHCVGHSLGGALATLCANWVSTSKSTYLYTFGSPRTGLASFAENITQKLNSENIFRAYHKTDPVPKLLPWPYTHVPFSGGDYYLPSPGSNFSATYHGMDMYIATIKREGNWPQLKGFVEEKKTDFGIARWLESKETNSLTVTVVGWLEQALVWVLKKCLGAAHTALAGLVGGSITLIDKLAYILAKGVNLAENISYWVLLFIKKLMQVLGMPFVSDKLEMSQNFIRSVMVRLQREVTIASQQALMQKIG
ncbi:MAG: triacylglycerol lipase [Psychromonas sp.]|jgi:triacylglycerol lipase|uniref:lipase family protein n=1 Tax=Psychromonas sp. TaxID=1884585 RepID=UPI0039E6F2D1